MFVLQVAGDKGIAIDIAPAEGVLPPEGSFSCTLHCATALVGDYSDTLHVQVSEMLQQCRSLNPPRDIAP